jgi:hypothetical protein
MTEASFKDSLLQNEPPQSCDVYFKALWFAGKGEWDKAHNLIQDVEDKNAAWIHGYLHRQEGDTSNADYWYCRAGRSRPNVELEEEWIEIVSALI